jgi:hypothetical protein
MAARLSLLERKEAALSTALDQAESRLATSRKVVTKSTPANTAMIAGHGNRGAMIAPPPYAGRDMTEFFDAFVPTLLQGAGTLRTWSFANPKVNFVQLLLKTEGRPLDADIQLWQGPDNTPHKLKVYVEDGGLRTFHTLIGTPGEENTIAIRNIGMLEFPLQAVVEIDRSSIPGVNTAELNGGGGGRAAALFLEETGRPELIQGGALRTYPFDVQVESVAVLLKTDGRPLNARIELLQGPNNNKQVVEVYTEDGLLRPFFAIFETPGSGNVVRIVNTAPVEFPLAATVEPYGLADMDIDPWAMDGIAMGGYS